MLWYPAKAVRRLLAQAPVPGGPDRRRLVERRRVRALPGPADADADRVPTTSRQSRQRGDATRPGWRSTAATRSRSTTIRAGRAAEDGLDLQLPAAQHRAGGEPAEGRVDRLRGPGRRPAVHDRPQRRGHQQFDNDPAHTRRAAATRRPRRGSSPRATSACRTTATRTRCGTATCACRTSRRRAARPAPGRSRSRARPPHGRVPLDRLGRQHRGQRTLSTARSARAPARRPGARRDTAAAVVDTPATSGSLDGVPDGRETLRPAAA